MKEDVNVMLHHMFAWGIATVAVFAIDPVFAGVSIRELIGNNFLSAIYGFMCFLFLIAGVAVICGIGSYFLSGYLLKDRASKWKNALAWLPVFLVALALLWIRS